MTQQMDRSAAQHAGGWIVMAGLFLLACLWFKQPTQPQPSLPRGSQLELGIDINRAGPAELACIPGVGQSLAERIVEYRIAHGPFQSLDELQQVPGVGPAKAAQLADALLPFPNPPTRLAVSPLTPSSAIETK